MQRQKVAQRVHRQMQLLGSGPIDGVGVALDWLS